VALLAISLVFLTLAGTSPTVAADLGPNARAIERVMEVQDRHTGRLMALPGVVGTATGLNAAGKPVVKIFLAKAGVAGVPANLEGVPVVVEVTGVFIALGDTAARYRPAPIGVSTGHPSITAGTIGCRVTDGTNVYALSNNHVYADENFAEIGDPTLQPGAYDGGTVESDQIGTLWDFEPLIFGGSDNTIDAAIAISTTGLLDNETLSDGYGIPSAEVAVASLGQNVQKYGRTTSLTRGYVSGINATANVGYSSGTAYFVDQIIATAHEGKFIQGGDSGSLMVTDPGKNPVGLLFAGPRSGRYGIANRIDLVLSRFNVTVDGDATPPNDPPVVTITSPADDDDPFDSGATISFAGTATDTEDGDLTASLVWTSDLDGQIGTGGSFSTTLNDGTHTITASVTDSGGLTGSDSISITVGEPAPDVTVESVVPDSGTPGQTLNVTITGTGFQDGATADFGDRVTVQLLTFDGSTTLLARIKIHPRAASGLRDVTVTNPDGSSGTLADGFEVL
jgi:hypothetical protein